MIILAVALVLLVIGNQFPEETISSSPILDNIITETMETPAAVEKTADGTITRFGAVVGEPVKWEERDSTGELIQEYFTEAPQLIEETRERGKHVTVTAPDELGYEDVLAYTTIPETFNIRDPSQLRVFWEEEQRSVDREVLDTNNNGIVDTVTWKVAHLSEQHYIIIVITEAEHLDEDRDFISNIFDDVKELDGNWSESIPDQHYVRVTFEKKLRSHNDITIFPRIVSGTPQVEIYEVNGTEIIAEFTAISENEYNTVYLTGLEGRQDVFDLRIIGGNLEFDHIIDPIPPLVITLDYQNTSFMGCDELGDDTPKDPGHGDYQDWTAAGECDNNLTSISADDNDRAIDEADLAVSDEFVNHWYNFTVNYDWTEIQTIELLWVGYDELDTGDDFEFDIWNFRDQEWDVVNTTTTSQSKDIYYGTNFSTLLGHNLSQYVNGSRLHLGVSGDHEINTPIKLIQSPDVQYFGEELDYQEPDTCYGEYCNLNDKQLREAIDSALEKGIAYELSQPLNDTLLNNFNHLFLLSLLGQIDGDEKMKDDIFTMKKEYFTDVSSRKYSNIFPIIYLIAPVDITRTTYYQRVKDTPFTEALSLLNHRELATIAYYCEDIFSQYDPSLQEEIITYLTDTSLGNIDQEEDAYYLTTHALLYLYWMEENGCIDRSLVEKAADATVFRNKLSTSFSDWHIEGVFALLLTENEDDVKENWISLILENQREDGGWGPLPHLDSHTHTTGLALVTLAAYRDFVLDDQGPLPFPYELEPVEGDYYEQVMKVSSPFVYSIRYGDDLYEGNVFGTKTSQEKEGTEIIRLHKLDWRNPVIKIANEMNQQAFFDSVLLNVTYMGNDGIEFSRYKRPLNPGHRLDYLDENYQVVQSYDDLLLTFDYLGIEDTQIVSTDLMLFGYFERGDTWYPEFHNRRSLYTDYFRINLTIEQSYPITVDSPLNQSYNRTTVDLNVSADETIATVQLWFYSLDDLENITFTPNTTITTSPGPHHLIIYANVENDSENHWDNLTHVYFHTGIPVTACGTLDQPNSLYVMEQDIDGGGSTCLTIGAENITLDGRGYSITTTPVAGEAVAINATSIENFTLHNIIAADYNMSLTINDNVTDLPASIITIRNSTLYDVNATGLDHSGAGGTAGPGGHLSIYNSSVRTIYAWGGSAVGSGGSDRHGGEGGRLYLEDSNATQIHAFGGNGSNAVSGGDAGGGGNITINVTGINLTNSVINIDSGTPDGGNEKDPGRLILDYKTWFVDGNSSYGGNLTMSLINSTVNGGRIDFIGFFGSGAANISPHINISYNFVNLDSSQSNLEPLNVSANITLNDTPGAGFSSPQILRDGTLCPSSICVNLTPLDAVTVVFNVTHWSNYGLGDSDSGAPSVIIASPKNTTYNNATLTVNATVFEENPESGVVQVTLNDLATNYSLENISGTWGYTNTSFPEGVYTAQFLINDTGNNMNNTEIVTFTIDRTNPVISFIPPTPNNNSYQNETEIVVNTTSSDDHDLHYTIVDFNRDHVLWMRFDDLNGTGDPTDISSYGNNGSFGGDARIREDGYWGDTGDFDGYQDYVQIGPTGADPLIPDGSNYTISAWINTKNTSKTQGIYGSVSSTSTVYYSYFIYISGNHLRCLIGNSTNSDNRIVLSNIPNNTWYHVACTWNGSVHAGYLNGVEVTSEVPNLVGTIPQKGAVGNIREFIGSMYSPTNSNGFNGSIDEIMAFNRSLNGSEIAALYNASASNYHNRFVSLPEGAHSFTAHAVDAAGNRVQTETRNVTVDLVPPDTMFVIPTPDNNSKQNSSVAFLNLSTNNIQEEHYAFVNFENDVVFWATFDQRNSSNEPIDLSYRANDGAMKGDAYIDSDGKWGDALHVDGSGDYADFGNTQNHGANFTVSFWVRQANISQNAVPVGNVAGGSSGWMFYQNNLQNLHFFVYDYGDDNVNAGQVLPIGEWTHVAGISNTTHTCIYVDGNLADCDAKGAGNYAHPSVNGLWLGAYDTGDDGVPGNYFNGSIDDLIIFNRTLNDTEIASLFDASATQYRRNITVLAEGKYEYTGYAVDRAGNRNFTSQSFTIDQTNPDISFVDPTPPNGSSQSHPEIFVNLSTSDNIGDQYAFTDFDNDLLLWLTFDEIDVSGNLTDRSSHGSNATPHGGSALPGKGNFGDGYILDGATEWIEWNYSQAIDFRQNISFAGWVKTGSIAEQTIFEQCDSADDCSDTGEIELQIQSGGTIYFGYQLDSCLVSGGTIVSDDTWHHIVVTYNQSNITLYLDGAQEGSSGCAITSTAGKNITFGRLDYDLGTESYFNGSFDEFMFFNRSLSLEEVQSLHNASATQFAHNFTGLDEGTYNIIGYTVDNAGNWNQTAQRVITFNAQIPTITIHSPLNTTYYTATVELNVSADETIDSWWYQANENGTNITFTPNTTITTGDGLQNLTIYANDSLGFENFSTVFYTTDIEDVTVCRKLSKLNTYYRLLNDLSSTGHCINITNENIIFDGQGFTIQGDNGIADRGVFIDLGIVVTDNVTISNVNISDFGRGFFGYLVRYSLFENVTFTSNTQYGFAIDSSSHNIINNVTAVSNTDGLIIQSLSQNNTIENSNASLNSQEGILIASSDDNRVINSVMDGNNQNAVEMSGADDNILANLTITNTGQNAVSFLSTSTNGNILSNVSISGTNSNYDDIAFTAAGINRTVLIDTHLANYSFSGTGGTLSFRDTGEGEINFTGAINGSGTNLSADIDIAFNQAFVNISSNQFLNRSANISLTGSPGGAFTQPELKRDGDTCPASICTNLTPLDATTVIFNVTHWSNYSIGQSDDNNPLVTILSPLNQSYSNTTITFNATVFEQNPDSGIVQVTLNDLATNYTLENISGTWGYINTSISEGIHIVQFFVNDTVGNMNNTEQVTFTIDRTASTIDFVPPTPDNDSIISVPYIYANITSSDDNDHYTFVDFQDDLVFWMRFDDRNSTGDPTDLTQYENNGSLIGDAVINETGQWGIGVHLDGDGDEVIIEDHVSLEPENAITVSAWIKTNISEVGYVLHKIKTTNPFEGYALATNTIGTSNFHDDNEIAFWIGNSWISYDLDGDSLRINDNEWHHILATNNGTTTCLYWDGVQRSCQAVAFSSTTNSVDLRMGHQAFTDAYFNGSIDDVLIFNRSLTATEVMSLYDAAVTQYGNNFTGLSIGTYTFTGHSVDQAANRNQTNERFVTVDTGNPLVTIISPLNQSYSNTTITFNATVFEQNPDSGIVQVTLNDLATNYTLENISGTWGYTNTSVSEGVHIAQFLVNDTGGSMNNTEQVTFTIDRTAPAITIHSPQNITYAQETIDLNVTANEIIDTWWYEYNGNGTNITFTPNTTLIAAGDGLKNITVYANDSVGLENSAVAYFTIDIPTITECRTLGQDNMVYTLQNDLQVNGSHCLTITADNVTLEGQSYTIQGDDSLVPGVNTTGDRYNITIRNLVVSDFRNAIDIHTTTIASLTNLTLTSNALHGLSLTSVSLGTIQNITSSNNANSGIYYTLTDDITAVDITSNDNFHGIFGDATTNNTNTTTFTFSRNNYGIVMKGKTSFLSDGIIENSSVTGIRLEQDGDNNNFTNITILNSSMTSLIFVENAGSAPENNIFRNISISGNAAGVPELGYDDGDINGTTLIDTPIEDYAINSSGGTLIIENTQFGEIRFLDAINGSGDNLSDDIQITFNFTFVNTSQEGFNSSAEISLYGFPGTGFIQPQIKHNGVGCPASICTNLTPLDAATVIFNVTQWSNYSIGEGDEGNPLVTIISPLNQSYSNTTITFNATVFEQNPDTSIVQVTLNDLATNYTLENISGTWGYTNTSVSEGVHIAQFLFIDRGNNTNNTEQVTFTIDHTLPTITIHSPQNATYTQTSIELNVSADEPISTWWYALNGGTNQTFTPNTTITATEGLNNLTVYANDSAGNENFSQMFFAVDTTPPTITIHSPQNITYTQATIELNVSADEPISTWWYALNGSANTTFTPNTTFIGGQWLNNITVYANDSVGNENFSRVYFTIDLTLITGCQILDIPGTYYVLQNDINTNGTCFTIVADDIVIDGNGFQITGDDGITDSGVYSDGQDNITIRNMTINDFGYGVRFISTNNSFVRDSTLFSVTMQGVHLNNSLNDTVSNNNISDAAFFDGIMVTINSTNNTISNNTIVNASNAIDFEAGSGNNTVDNNTFNDTAAAGINASFAPSNSITNNKFYNTTDGISLSTGTDFATIINNTFLGSSGSAMRFTSSSTNVIVNNTIDQYGYGIYIATGSFDNQFTNISINGSNLDAILVTHTVGGSPAPNNNTFKQVTVTNTNTSREDFTFLSNIEEVNDTVFIDTHLQNYSFDTPDGGTFIFRDTNEGEIRFLLPINGTGENLTNDVQVNGNFAYVNSSISGMNASANITFYNSPGAGLTNPEIKRDGITCSSDICTNLTPLDTTTVIFNVTHWSNYTIGEDTTLDNCTILGVAGATYHLNNDISVDRTCFFVTADNITLEGNANTIDYTGGATAHGINGSGQTNFTLRNINISAFTYSVFFGGGMDEDGGAITIENATVEHLDTSGGRSGGGGYDGGDVLLINTTFMNISTVEGHCAGICDPHSGGNITIANSVVNLTELGMNLSADLPGRLRINFTDGFDDTNADYGDQLYLTIANLSGGEIHWAEYFNSTNLTNFSKEVNIRFNFAAANSTVFDDLNVSANISFFNTPASGLINPEIKRNGVSCGAICTNYTSLEAERVVFNVNYWTNYTLSGSNLIGECLTINNPGSYALTNNLFSNGTCILVAADNVVIDGDGFSVTGNGTGYGIERDLGQTNFTVENITISNYTTSIFFSDASTTGRDGGNVSVYSSNVSTLDIRGAQGNGVGGSGGDGGFVFIDNSIIDTILARGGFGAAPGGGGGSGGRVIIRNSTTPLINASGGSASQGDNHGGVGGNVTTIDSNTSIIYARGGNSTGSGQAGNGGLVTVKHVDLNLSHDTFDLIGGTGTTDGISGNLTLNYTNSIEDTQTDYGTALHLTATNTSAGAIRWLSEVNVTGFSSISQVMTIFFNHAEVNSSGFSLFNISADISLYNSPGAAFQFPEIKRNNNTCGIICANYTGLSDPVVVFNVLYWTNYSLGESIPNDFPSISIPEIYNASYAIDSDFSINDVVIIRVNLTDPDGTPDHVRINITDPTGSNQEENELMTEILLIPNGSTFEYNYTIDVNLSGLWIVSLTGFDDRSGSASSTGNFTVDISSPFRHTLQVNFTFNETPSLVYIPGVGIQSARDQTLAVHRNPPEWFLARWDDGLVSGLVFSRTTPIALVVNTSNAVHRHTLSIEQDMRHSQIFLPYTVGDYTTIQKRISAIEQGIFLAEYGPTFGFDLGSPGIIGIAVDYSKIDIQHDVIMRDTDRLVIESLGTQNGKEIINIEVV